MKIKERIEGDVVVLAISGKMMGGPETLEIQEKVKGLLSDNLKKFVFDLSSVKWMNSSGLGSLISAHTSIKNAEGNLKLAGATEKVQSLFIVTQLLSVFDTYETVDRALANF